MRKSVFMIWIGLLLAAPAFAVDGVEKIIGDTYNVSWGNYAIYKNMVLADLNGPGLVACDINTNTCSMIDSNYHGRFQKSIYGNKAVYYDSYGVKMIDIKTLEPRQISLVGSHPSIYGEKIAYIKNGNVFLYNLPDGTEQQISISGTVRAQNYYIGTAMDADHIVWIEDNAESQMIVYNRQTGLSRVLNILSPDLDYMWMFHIYENSIVWNRDKVFLYTLNDENTLSENYIPIHDPLQWGGTWGLWWTP